MEPGRKLGPAFDQFAQSQRMGQNKKARRQNRTTATKIWLSSKNKAKDAADMYMHTNNKLSIILLNYS